VRRTALLVPDGKRVAGLRDTLTLFRALEAFLDPLLILVWLLALAAWYDAALDARLVAACVLVFALAFPGDVALSDPPPVIWRKCLVISLTVLAGLALFGVAVAWRKIPPRRELAIGIALLPIMLFAVHLAVRIVLPRVLELARMQETVVICGVNEIGAGLAAHFQDNPYFGLNFLGYFDDRHRDRLQQIGTQPLLGAFRDLGNFARHHRVDRIYLSLPMATQPRIVRMLDDLRDSTASIYFAPDIFITDLINGKVESVGGLPVVAVRESPYAGANGVLKRAEDAALSLVALVLLAPLMAALALWVRRESPGPALARQRRYGLDGREITVYEFRVAPAGDPRATRLDRWLRRTELDKLPQLLNVLQGQMSLVGPQPTLDAVNQQYRRLIPDYMLRHKAKPGITGLAQVRGQRGVDLAGMTRRIASDIEYLRGWSLSLDLWILMVALLRLARGLRGGSGH
jgi:putative colanic acid biosysnthesis UDP-glucose lipid carrier transferase